MGTTTARVPGAGARTAGKAMLLIGIIALLGSVVVGVAQVLIGYGQIDSLDEIGTRFTGSVELTLTAGDTLRIYRETTAEAPSCEATGPAGPVDVDQFTSGTNENGWTAIGPLRATSTGTYVLQCDTPQTLLAAEQEDDLPFSGVLLVMGGYLAGTIGGAGGLLLAVVGLVMLLAGRHHGRSGAA